MQRNNTEKQQKRGHVDVEWLVTFLNGMAESQLYATNCHFKKCIYYMKPENGDRNQ